MRTDELDVRAGDYADVLAATMSIFRSAHGHVRASQTDLTLREQIYLLVKSAGLRGLRLPPILAHFPARPAGLIIANLDYFRQHKLLTRKKDGSFVAVQELRPAAPEAEAL